MSNNPAEFTGEVSEWNEGNFKSMRLHQAQVLINNSKIAPFSRVSVEFDKSGAKYGYELWFAGIDVMFGEGQQKYSKSEAKEVMDKKKKVEEMMSSQICSPISNSAQKGVMVFTENWLQLKNKLEELEYLVKSYNDKHGLSTKNVGTKGLF